MSHYVAATDLPKGGEKLQVDRISVIQTLCLLVGGAGLILSAILMFPAIFGNKEPDSLCYTFSFSWLFAFEVFFTLTTGSLFWCLLHNASNSGWGVAIRRVPETLANNFGLMFFLGLPLIFVPSIRETVWTWIGHHAVIKANPPAGAESLSDALHAGGHATHLLHHKLPYLHLGWAALPGWDFRYIIFFAVLGFGAWKLRAYSLEQDRTGAVKPTFSARRFSCGWLPLFAVCSTFAGVDWVKSLNYKWFSTMWGVNVFAASALSSMALIIIIVGYLKQTGHFKNIVSDEHFHIMGKLMLAFTIFWAYITFSQYFLIWYANVPEETQFYGIRNTGGWWLLSIGLTFLHFLVPFVVLLKRNVKKSIPMIMGIAAYILCVHLLEIYWWILPQRGPVLYDASAGQGARLFLDFGLDLLALVTIGGLYGFFFFRRLAKGSIYPCGDPRLEESVNLHN